MIDSNCPFCNDDIKKRQVFETQFSRVILARHGIHAAQSLIIPKRHIETLNELSDVEISDIAYCTKRVALIVRQVYKNIEGLNIVLNDGWAAGQSETHIHYHLIPRVSGDISELRFKS